MIMRKLFDFIMRHAAAFLILIFLVIIVMGYFLLGGKRYEGLAVQLESSSEKYTSNQLRLSYIDNGEIDKVVLKYNNSEIAMKNGSVINLSENLDGSSFNLDVFVYYVDGDIEVFSKSYDIYEECANNVVEKINKTDCSSGVSFYYEDKIITDKATSKICLKEKKEKMCSNKEESNSNNNNDKKTDNNKGDNNKKTDNNKDDNNKKTDSDKKQEKESSKDNSNNSSESKNNSDSGTDKTSNNKNDPPEKNDKEDSNRGCKLTVSSGTLGNNGWYVSGVTLSLNINGTKVSKYGISTSSTEKYNNKKSLKISESHKDKKYYGYVKYKDGKVFKCSVSVKIDLDKPGSVNSEIRKSNSSGEKISNSTAYRNYRVWWGNFNTLDNVSGVDHYEYSTNCTGNKTNNLKSEYYYPSSSKDSYNGTYCIRAVDKAGNNGPWSSPYTFKADLVKPTCSVKIEGNGNYDNVVVTANDTVSGVAGYSYNNASYTSSNVFKINKGTKVTVSVKDKAGNVGSCFNYKTALVLVGDSRTYWLQRDVGGKRILTEFDDIYSIESSDTQEVYAVCKSGAKRSWLLGYSGAEYDSGAYQVDYLLKHLGNKNIYYDVKLATNLGVNDINSYTAENASSAYISAYNNLRNSNQSVVVDSTTKNANWRKRGNIIGVNLYFISVNPIDENLLKAYKPSSKRKNSTINSYNQIMKKHFGGMYIDSASKFNSWFLAADKAGQPRYSVRQCTDSNNKKYSCQDGLHYSPYLNQKYIYNFYKSSFLG